jgi:transcriptional regulator with PAS, ATPase and Fis domain
VAVNCGAIPETLIESELFGHERGAFTGAQQARQGLFESADDGSIFLDEIGELPKPAQVKLLRVLQEGEVTRLGANKAIKVNVRVIAATNRTLMEEVARGSFREDLYYRVAVATLRLPALRERPGDLTLLVDHLLEKINVEMAQEPGFKQKHLSAGARNLLLTSPWPGNVRELANTLTRAAAWSTDETISLDEVRESLGELRSTREDQILGRILGPSLDLQTLLGEVACHYLKRALAEASGNKTKAAELLGLPSYQTLSNWMKRYGVAE